MGNPIGASQADVEKSVPYGTLVSERPGTHAAGLPFTGQTAVDPISLKTSAVLHAEFEGRGTQDASDGAAVALFMAFAGLIICVAVPPPWGAIIGAVLAFLAFLAQLLGALLGRGDKGSVGDVAPELGALHPRDPGGTTFDVLGVFGRWVYDAGHNNEGVGWNEIHAVKACYRAGTWNGDGDWPPFADAYADRFPDAYTGATSQATRDAQDAPENQWTIHPRIDGCASPPPPPVIK